MKISNEFKIRSDPPLCLYHLAFENFPMHLLLGNRCMSVCFASFVEAGQTQCSKLFESRPDLNTDCGVSCL